MPPPAASLDAVVVGAGLAGLAAAVRLTAAARRVAVLEAGDAVGGRVRTDLVDGFRLDRGFQVFNPAYPEARRVLDLPALALRPFVAGALVCVDGGRYLVGDPRRTPAGLLGGLWAPLGSPLGRLRFGVKAAYDALVPPRQLLAAPDTTTADALRGYPPELVDRVIRPFFAGVFLERELTTSARFFALLLRTFARGTPAVPALGMGEIPAQLARRLPPGTLRLHTRVVDVRADEVATADGTVLRASGTVVAADPVTAAGLVGFDPPTIHAVTTVYHAAPTPPLDRGVIVLDGDQVDTGFGPIVNTLVLSAAAPSYAPPGSALVSTSVLGAYDDPALDAALRPRLATLYRTDTTGWRHLATYPVRAGLPAAPPPLDPRQPVRLGPGRYVSGDWRDTPSQQGALVSGRRAAEAVLRDLA